RHTTDNLACRFDLHEATITREVSPVLADVNNLIQWENTRRDKIRNVNAPGDSVQRNLVSNCARIAHAAGFIDRNPARAGFYQAARLEPDENILLVAAIALIRVAFVMRNHLDGADR